MSGKGKNQGTRLLLCPYCIEEIESRGERLKKYSFSEMIESENGCCCGWCNETNEELTECEFT